MVLLSVHHSTYTSNVFISFIDIAVSKFAAAGRCPGRNLTENFCNIEHSNERHLILSSIYFNREAIHFEHQRKTGNQRKTSH